jgi:hypothetical protein
MSNPILVFKIDPEREYEYLRMFIESGSPEFALLPDDIQEQVTKSGIALMHGEIRDLINSEWRKVEQKYFKFISQVVGEDWEFPEYYCFGSVLSYSNY